MKARCHGNISLLATNHSKEGRRIDAIICLILLLIVAPALYGLHRLGLYLERRGLIDYSHTNSSGGSAYSPLQEIYQPQIRNVIEVREQRLGEDQDDEGSSPPV